MVKLSVVVITLNEEKNIQRCLESVKDIADEIILVDSGSSDRTVELAKSYGAKTFIRKFDNFANQKNFASDKASGEWIFSIDADEEVPKTLGSEIKTVIKNDEYEGYLIGRRNFILGAEIKHSRWSPDAHIWLWKKEKGRWVGEVHEEVKVDGRVGKLKASKIHYQSKTLGEFMESNEQYSSLEAENLHKKGIRFSIWNLIKDSGFEFLVRFIYKKGFLDGWRGLVLSVAMTKYKIDVWIKLSKLER